MSIFNRSQPVEQRFGFDLPDAMNHLRQARLSGSWAGLPVTPENVLSVPSVFACEQFTAGLISQLPFDEYIDVPGTGRSERAPSPILASPSADVTPEDWRFQAVESAQLHGNAVGVIVSRDRRSYPTQIELVHPSRVQVRVDQVSRRIEWKIDNGVMSADDIWHMAGRPTVGSPLGVGLLEFMATTAGVGLAARKYGADWFAHGGAPVAVVQPQMDPGDEGAFRLKEKIRSAIRSREPLVLPKTTEVNSWPGSSPSDADLVRLLRHNASDVAMFYCVPAELVGGQSGDSMTYSNVEHRVLDLLVFGVSYWLTKLEKALSRSLPAGRFVKANEAAIIRTDIATRTKVLVDEVRGGLRTPNEARGLLDLPSDPASNRLLWPPFTVQVQTMTEDAITSSTPVE